MGEKRLGDLKTRLGGSAKLAKGPVGPGEQWKSISWRSLKIFVSRVIRQLPCIDLVKQ